jgi:hypothetical protein
LVTIFLDFQNDFDHVVDVALRVNAARDGEADQIHLRGRPKHQTTNLNRADSAFQIEFGCERNTGKLLGRDVGQEGAGIDVNSVTVGWLDNRYALRGDVITQISGGGYPLLQVILVQDLLQANGDRLQVASRQASVRRIPLGQDEQVFLALRQGVIIRAREAANVGHAIFLCRHGAAVSVAEHFLRELLGRF